MPVSLVARSPRFGRTPMRPQIAAIDRKPNHIKGDIRMCAAMMAGEGDKIYLDIDYEDTYVQPLLIAALKAHLPPELLVFVQDTKQAPPPEAKILQWRQYESIDFENLLQRSSRSLANSYIIRKALIRKHYLSTTISHWLAKHPDSILKDHVKPSVDFEVDYAEFLDDALVEAWELKEAWARNEGRGDDGEREWWILKPGMSERGQGIRLFSSEEELQAIFQEWDPESDDEEEEDGDDQDEDDAAAHSGDETDQLSNPKKPAQTNAIMTSHLRHFTAQPYISDPLLLPSPHPCAGRKFHIRTYVLAVGALKIYVYRPMLALFAGKAYATPSAASEATHPNQDLSRHLTNTCLQTGEREGSVVRFWDLPFHGCIAGEPDSDGKDEAFKQICTITGEIFEAAARSMGIHFQPLPNAFEIFGLDFLVDGEGKCWLLEVNAFPDFAQTGSECKGVVEGLFQGVVEVAVKPFFGLNDEEREDRESSMVKVLNIDLGRR